MAVGTQGARQFQGLFTVIPFKASVNFASTVDGNEAASDITVAGAALGDFVLIAPALDVIDMGLTAQVTAADTVTAQVWNNTGGTIDLAVQTFTGVVLKPNANVFAQL